jgi:PAS domain S-box-containing protein
MKAGVASRRSSDRQKTLRRRAEEALRAENLLIATGQQVSSMSKEELRRVVYELRVYQIELELQNQELRDAQVELSQSRDRLSDLYEFAPIGYVTLDAKGRIAECNLAAAAMLRVNRFNLIGAAISHFVAREFWDEILLHLRAVFSGDPKRVVELTMRKSNGALMSVRLESLLQQSPDTGTRYCRTALIDVTDARIAQRKLEQLNEELEQRIQARTADLQRRTDELTEQAARLKQYKEHLQVMALETVLIEARERQRLAEDLHDNLGQALFRVKMQLARTPLTAEAVAEIHKIVEEMSRTVNSLTYELNPLVLSGSGLSETLQWLAKALKRRYGLNIRVTLNDDGISLDENTALILFRSVREILINVAKHGETSFASLSLRKSNGSLAVMIKDRGKGFDLDEARHVKDGHFGLFSVRERLQYLGGSLKIQSTQGVGTKVTVSVPCKLQK